MNNRKLTIFENDGIKDTANIKGTSIILKELDSGKVLFRGSNKVIVSGSEFNALKDFDFDNFNCSTDFLSSIPSYDKAFEAANYPFKYESGKTTPTDINGILSNSDLGFYKSGILNSIELDNKNEDHHKLYQYFTRRVCLWCLGIDGCGVEASRVFKVHNTKWIAPYGYADYNDGTGKATVYNDIDNCLIPFKYRTSDADLDESYRKLYFGRAEIGSSIGYFFKTFDDSTLYRRYADDSSDLEGVEDVWKDKRASEAEVVVQLKMSVSATDCREYFQKSVGVNDSKVNTISLCTAVPYIRKNANNAIEYLDIRPFTRFNFPNEALIDTSKGIDITYYLYY